MVIRDQLTQYLSELYDYDAFEDYCENGLQVEGIQSIEKIVFGVSFNIPLLDKAVHEKAQAIIVHHGIFQNGVFKLKGPLKQKVQRLLDNGISLYGIHLPMDGHPEIGHNALLLKTIGAENITPFESGFKGENAQGHTLDKILSLLHEKLHPTTYHVPSANGAHRHFGLSTRYGFTVLENGPEIPKQITAISGGSSRYYENAVETGSDTFLGGEIKEQTPSFSLDTATNFVNLGHYFSEKPGVLELKKAIEKKFNVETLYVEIPNPV